jgi:hypothetical protein
MAECDELPTRNDSSIAVSGEEHRIGGCPRVSREMEMRVDA